MAPYANLEEQILQLVADVAQKKVSAEELRGPLETLERGVDHCARELMGVLEPLPAKLRFLCEPLLPSGRELIEQIRLAARELSRFIDEPDDNLLFSGADRLRCSSLQLSLFCEHLRNVLWSHQGPTEIAHLNALLWAYDDYRKGAVREISLKPLAHQEQTEAARSLRELSHVPDVLEVQILRKTWLDHHRAALLLLGAKLPAEVGKAVTFLTATFLRLQEAIPRANEAIRSRGETPSALVNVVLGLIRDVRAQRLQDVVLLEALGRLEIVTAESRAQFVQSTSDETDSALMQEQRARISGALEQQQEALGVLFGYFRQRDVALLQTASQLLRKATNELHAGYQKLQQLELRSKFAYCLRCARPNAWESARCKACGAALPLRFDTDNSREITEGLPPPEVAPMSANLWRLYSAVEQAAAGKCTDEAFSAELEQFLARLETAFHRYQWEDPDLEGLSAEQRRQAEELLRPVWQLEETMASGFQIFEEGLSSLRNYLLAHDVSYLQEGVRLCNEAALRFQEVGQAVSSH